jgi:hypothetical protein
MGLRKKKKSFKGEAKSGALYVVAILGIVATFGGVLVGGAVPDIKTLSTPAQQNNLYTCCDTGDGDACKPILEKQITYNGDTYALLKSSIGQEEVEEHIAPANGTSQFTPDGYRIFINTSDTTADYSDNAQFPGCEHGKDLIGLNDPSKKWGGCFGIPNDELIYVCKDTPEQCAKLTNKNTVPFDVYYRVKDGPVPAEIASYCPKPADTSYTSQQEVVGVPTPGGRDNLQLETFQVKQDKKLYNWLGAWCKPAIYLYPKEKTDVNVQVNPKGTFRLTIPQYPQGGWNVTAYPNGKIFEHGTEYPYLYWEASMPDNVLTEPKDGYVVTKDELQSLFDRVLPALGLNGMETNEFSKYWIKTLPASPYYFVGVVPQSEIDAWAPLNITPKPDSIGRVTLYFKTLDKRIVVKEPILTGFARTGFNVTEWGGLFKADKNHKDFTCAM